ncbi:MAG: Rab family GTPase [Promethearchaeota archaeon]
MNPLNNYIPTLGIDFEKKIIAVNNTLCFIYIWDLSGLVVQKISSGMSSAEFYLKNALLNVAGCVLVYDTTQSETFNNIKFWIDEVKKYVNNFDQGSFILVGNKIDREQEQQKIDNHKLNEILRTHCINNHLLVSAKTRHNIDDIFIKLTCEMIEKKGNND